MSKLPISFDLKILFRMLLPGFVFALGVLPLARRLLLANGYEPNLEYLLTILTLVLGWLIILLDIHIYMAYEGRRYWPARLREWGLGREQARLDRLYRWHDDPATPSALKKEAAGELRNFPVKTEITDEQDARQGFMVAYPSRLGNLLAAYEGYARSRYCLNDIFYWYRIWLTLDNDKRQELDTAGALADSALYLSAALYADGLLLFLYGLVGGVSYGQTSLSPSADVSLLLALLAIAGGYLMYRGSLHSHISSGKLMNAMFDLYRSKMDIDAIVDGISGACGMKIVDKEAPASEKYKAAWMYLANYMIRDGERSVPVPWYRKLHQECGEHPASAPWHRKLHQESRP